MALKQIKCTLTYIHALQHYFKYNVENDHDDDNVNEDDDEAPNSTVLYTFYNLTTIF